MTRLFLVAAAMLPLVLTSLPAFAQERVLEPAVLRDALDSRVESSEGEERRAWLGLRQMYADRRFVALWIGDTRREMRAHDMLLRIAAAVNDGLDPADYAVEASWYDLADLELGLTASSTRLGRHLAAGRLTPSLEPREIGSLPVHLQPGPLAARIAESADPAAILDELEPRDRRYRLLETALAALREVEAAGGWPEVPALRPLDLWARGSDVEALRRRLMVTEDPGLLDVEYPVIFDARLGEAVTAFQRRHGLDADGVVGPRTFAALNVGVQERIAQIEANLERWRWLPEDLGERHVFVDVASFELALVEGGRPALELPVVVGKEEDATPIFSQAMTHIIINPSWHVPKRIAVEELLPDIQADPGFLERNDLRVLDKKGHQVDSALVAWDTLGPDNFPYRLVQTPGDQNSLGEIKFMLPNRFDIYLHDTPAKTLFDRQVRAFSHGCVRVRDPLILGAAVLGRQGWDLGQLESAVAEGRSRRIDIEQPLPVHIAYFTARADEPGQIRFLDDIYGHDIDLISSLGR